MGNGFHQPSNGYHQPGNGYHQLGNGYHQKENGYAPQPAPYPCHPPPSVPVRRGCLRRTDAVKTPWQETPLPRGVSLPSPAVTRHSWQEQTSYPGPYTDPCPPQPNPAYSNGTYPGDSLVRFHRKLPAVPKNKFAHQHSLPDDYSNPYRRDSYVTKISSYFKPLGPIKPSSLSIRQSSALNGSPSYTLMGAPNFQMPTVSESPTVQGQTNSLVAINGVLGDHHRSLPSQPRRTLPQPPVARTPHGTSKLPANGGFGGLSDLFSRNSRDFDWI